MASKPLIFLASLFTIDYILRALFFHCTGFWLDYKYSPSCEILFFVPLSFYFYTIPLTSETDTDPIKLNMSSIKNQASSFFLGVF